MLQNVPKNYIGEGTINPSLDNRISGRRGRSRPNEPPDQRAMTPLHADER